MRRTGSSSRKRARRRRTRRADETAAKLPVSDVAKGSILLKNSCWASAENPQAVWGLESARSRGGTNFPRSPATVASDSPAGPRLNDSRSNARRSAKSLLLRKGVLQLNRSIRVIEPGRPSRRRRSFEPFRYRVEPARWPADELGARGDQYDWAAEPFRTPRVALRCAQGRFRSIRR
jgi:hypothetical protein